MAQFPKTEQGIVSLAERMIAGLTEHPDDFPSVTTASVHTMLDDYKLRLDGYEDAQSQVKTTLTLKADSLDALVQVMKSDLKQAEVDVGAATDKLYEIGWGPRQTPQPQVLEIPGQVTQLHPVAEGSGMICLNWQSPADGGQVASYIIERQQQAEGGQYGEWIIAGNVFDTNCRLINQPENVRLGYRVKAVNATGEGMASSVTSVVLP